MINHELIFRCSKRFTDPDNPRYLSIGFPKGAAITTWFRDVLSFQKTSKAIAINFQTRDRPKCWSTLGSCCKSQNRSLPHFGRRELCDSGKFWQILWISHDLSNKHGGLTVWSSNLAGKSLLQQVLQIVLVAPEYHATASSTVYIHFAGTLRVMIPVALASYFSMATVSSKSLHSGKLT
jgi:hypothetical protein